MAYTLLKACARNVLHLSLLLFCAGEFILQRSFRMRCKEGPLEETSLSSCCWKILRVLFAVLDVDI